MKRSMTGVWKYRTRNGSEQLQLPQQPWYGRNSVTIVPHRYEKVESRMKLSRETCLLCKQSFLLGVENIVFLYVFCPLSLRKWGWKNECWILCISFSEGRKPTMWLWDSNGSSGIHAVCGKTPHSSYSAGGSPSTDGNDLSRQWIHTGSVCHRGAWAE